MSWTDEEIDNLFQESATAQSFEYNNAYFGEVEAMLPVNKKGKDFLWMGTALLFIGVLTTGYFLNNSNENTFNSANDQLANFELNIGNKTKVDAKSSTKNQQLTKRNTGLNELTNETSNSDLTSINLTSNDLTDASTDNSNLSNGETNTYSASQQKGSIQSTNTAIDGSRGNVAQSKALTPAEVQATVLAERDLIKDQNLKNEQLIELPLNTEVKNQKDLDFTRAPITAGLNVNSPNQLDQGLDRSLVPNSLLAMPALSQLRPKSAFYVELNAGISQSLVIPSDYTSASYGGGFGVESYLGKFNLTTGLNFKLSDHKDLYLTRAAKNKYYSFGSTYGKSTYDFRKVYSVEMPISLGYSLGNHNLNIGVRPSILIGAKMKQEAFNGEELVRSEESIGLLDGGLKRFGVKPTLGYSYHMNKWTVGANIGVQLMQTVDEDFIDGINNKFPIDGQIYLRRTIRLRK